MSRRSPTWLPWAASMLLAVACGAEPPSDPSESYVLQLADGVRGSRGQVAWIRDVVDEGVEDTRWLRAEGAGPPLSTELSFEELAIEPGRPVLRVMVTVDPDPELAVAMAAVDLELEAHVELERRDGTIELERDLPFAVHRALAIIDAKITVARGEVDALAGLLADEDPEVVLVGLAGVQTRRERSLGDPVFRLLEHDDERIALRAVECLGTIGGPEHAPGLLRGARLADRAHVNRLYEALANLGGEHARGFLEFAVRNEEDPELASLAQRALKRLDTTEPRSSPSEEAAVVARGHRQ